MPFHAFDVSRNRVHLVSLSCSSVPPSRYGGIELVIANISEGLRDRGIQCVVYSPGDMTIAGVEHARTLSSPSKPVRDGGNANTTEHLLAVAHHLGERVQKGDVVLLHHPDHFEYLRWRIRTRLSWRARFYEVAHWTFTRMRSNIVYPSLGLKEHIGKPGVVIPHGERFEALNHSIAREDFLLYAGRITEDKGIRVAVDAARLACAKLVVAGPRHDERLAEEVLAQPHVQYVGELSSSELVSCYHRARALVYPTQYIEPFGLSIIEAMAYGCPILTTGLGGTGETIVPGVTGFLCADAEAIARAVDRLDSLSHDAIVERGRSYSIEAMAEGYHRLVEGKSDGAATGMS